MGILCLVLVLLFSTLCPSSVAITFMGKGELVCFTLIVFLMSCGCSCSVAFPNGSMCWSAVYDCGIFYSYLLAFLKLYQISYNV